MNGVHPFNVGSMEVLRFHHHTFDIIIDAGTRESTKKMRTAGMSLAHLPQEDR